MRSGFLRNIGCRDKKNLFKERTFITDKIHRIIVTDFSNIFLITQYDESRKRKGTLILLTCGQHLFYDVIQTYMTFQIFL